MATTPDGLEPKNLITSEEFDARVYRMAKAIQNGFRKSGREVDWWQCRKAAVGVIKMVWNYK